MLIVSILKVDESVMQGQDDPVQNYGIYSAVSSDEDTLSGKETTSDEDTSCCSSEIYEDSSTGNSDDEDCGEAYTGGDENTPFLKTKNAYLKSKKECKYNMHTLRTF